MELSNAQKGERGNTKYGVFHATVTQGKKVDVDQTTTKIIMTEYNNIMSHDGNETWLVGCQSGLTWLLQR